MIQLCWSASSAKTKPVSFRSADVQRDAGREERGVGEAALDDDFDVAQPVADDRRRKRQRHEAERDRGQLQRERRIDAERPRQRVAERERPDAERRAPRDPAQLAPRR